MHSQVLPSDPFKRGDLMILGWSKGHLMKEAGIGSIDGID